MTAPSSTAHEFFVDAWNVYRELVSRNYMFHKEIYAEVERLLRESFERPFSLLDLGCGDAANIAPVLKSLDLAGYRGVDLSDTALQLASENLDGLPFPADLRNAELLDYLESDSASYDVIFSSFALHHLATERKQEFFRHCARRLSPHGLLLLIDVAREEDQPLPAYLDAYCGMMERDWHGLDPAEMDYAISHVRDNDRPETLSDLRAMAERAGLSDFRHVARYTWHHVLCFRQK
jgi:SAM-dependent methyltransferase